MTGEESMRVHGEIERLTAELAQARADLARQREVVQLARGAFLMGGIDARTRLGRAVRALLDAERAR